MPTELKDLELFEVSLVDAGDDPLAKVTLFKRKGNSDMSDEVMKTKEDVEKELTEANETIETLKAKVEELEAKEVEIEKAKTDEDTIEIDGEKIQKSAIPATVLKALEKERAAKEELQKAADKSALEKRAVETFKNMKGTPEQKGRLFKFVEADAELMEILRAVDALFANLTQEVGDTEVAKEMKEAKDLVEEEVSKLQTVDKSLTYHQAYAKLASTPEGLQLITKTYNKGN